MVLKVVLGIIFAASFSSGAEGREAKVLLKVRDNKTYELVEDVLKEMSNLKRPIRKGWKIYHVKPHKPHLGWKGEGTFG